MTPEELIDWLLLLGAVPSGGFAPTDQRYYYAFNIPSVNGYEASVVIPKADSPVQNQYGTVCVDGVWLDPEQALAAVRRMCGVSPWQPKIQRQQKT